MAFAQGEVVDAEHARRHGRRVRQGVDQPQQGGAADGRAEHGGQPGATSSSQHECDHLQNRVQPLTSPPVPEGEPVDLLDERRPRARSHRAAKAPDQQVHDHRPTAHRCVGQAALVAAVDSPGPRPAGRAGGLARACAGGHADRVFAEFDLVDLQAVQVGEQDVPYLHIAHGA